MTGEYLPGHTAHPAFPPQLGTVSISAFTSWFSLLADLPIHTLPLTCLPVPAIVLSATITPVYTHCRTLPGTDACPSLHPPNARAFARLSTTTLYSLLYIPACPPTSQHTTPGHLPVPHAAPRLTYLPYTTTHHFPHHTPHYLLGLCMLRLTPRIPTPQACCRRWTLPSFGLLLLVDMPSVVHGKHSTSRMPLCERRKERGKPVTVVYALYTFTMFCMLCRLPYLPFTALCVLTCHTAC